jgi:hypothetical protein
MKGRGRDIIWSSVPVSPRRNWAEPRQFSAMIAGLWAMTSTRDLPSMKQNATHLAAMPGVTPSLLGQIVGNRQGAFFHLSSVKWKISCYQMLLRRMKSVEHVVRMGVINTYKIWIENPQLFGSLRYNLEIKIKTDYEEYDVAIWTDVNWFRLGPSRVFLWIR